MSKSYKYVYIILNMSLYITVNKISDHHYIKVNFTASL